MISFIAGVASFFFVERQVTLASWIVVFLFLSWLWFEMEGLVAAWVKRHTKFEMPAFLVSFAAQGLHQEALFFVIPFVFVHTAWHTSHAVFSGLVILLAGVSVLDNVYYPLVSNRLIRALVHGFVAFLIMLVALPQLIHLTTSTSLRIACLSMGLLSIPAIYRTMTGTVQKRLGSAVLIAVLLAGVFYLGRGFIPPISLRVSEIYPSYQIDTAARKGSPIEGVIPSDRLDSGLWVFSSVKAPRGLKEDIFHEWYFEGELLDRVKLAVVGGREQGFRSWSKKDHFPANPVGRWKVRVTTLDGQFIGSCTFDIVAGKSED